MDSPEIHAPHKSHTGHRWLDITLGVSALLVSAVSLYVAVHHGETMEKLVEANSFPSAEIDGSIVDAQAANRFIFKIDAENNGVGPARIETVELWDGSRPLESVSDLLAAVKARGNGQALSARIAGETLTGSLLGAGKSKNLFSMEVDRATWFAPVLRFSNIVNSRVCYCSVFDECFVSDSRIDASRPHHVKICPAPPHPYKEDVANVMSAKIGGTEPINNDSQSSSH